MPGKTWRNTLIQNTLTKFKLSKILHPVYSLSMIHSNRTVGKPSDSTVMQKPLAHDKPDSTGSHCNNKTDLPKIKDRPKWIANPSPSDNPVAINTDKLPPSNILLEQLSW